MSVDPRALLRSWTHSLNPQAALDDNDGHGFFGALGDVVVTGATLTNSTISARS